MVRSISIGTITALAVEVVPIPPLKRTASEELQPGPTLGAAPQQPTGLQLQDLERCEKIRTALSRPA